MLCDFLFFLIKKIGYEVCDYYFLFKKNSKWTVFNKQTFFRGDLSPGKKNIKRKGKKKEDKIVSTRRATR